MLSEVGKVYQALSWLNKCSYLGSNNNCTLEFITNRVKMFQPITVPYESVMLLNECRLKDGVEFDDVKLAIAEVCSKTKDTQDRFIAGQVFSYAGFILPEGSIGEHE